eukprot:COSAG05_NODE_143_length_16570_cov_12.041953_11_plen_33_part_00
MDGIGPAILFARLREDVRVAVLAWPASHNLRG